MEDSTKQIFRDRSHQHHRRNTSDISHLSHHSRKNSGFSVANYTPSQPQPNPHCETSFDSTYSDASKSSSHVSGYSGYSHGSSSYGTGRISAFSSVADLKAQLKKKELIREERRRKRQQMIREQQHQQMTMGGGDDELQQQLQQPQMMQQQQQTLPNPISFTITSKIFPAQHKHIHTNHSSMDDADMALLGFSLNERPAEEEEDHNGTKNNEIHKGRLQPNASSDFELRDDNGDQSALRNGRTNDEQHLHQQHQDLQKQTGEKIMRPALISLQKQGNNQPGQDDDVSQMTTSAQSLFSLSTKKQEKCKNKEKKSTSKEEDDEEPRSKPDLGKKRGFSITKPFRKMFGKMWRKVKPYLNGRKARSVFTKDDSIKLKRAKGNLC